MKSLQVLGIGDAFTDSGFNTCFLVTSGRERILIDGTPGLFRAFRQYGIDRGSVSAAVLTHIHSDHASGLETLVVWRRLHLGERTRIFTSLRVFESMHKAFFPPFQMGFSSDLKTTKPGRLEDYVDFRELPEDGKTELLPGVKVEIRHNWHPVPTLGLKLDFGRTRLGISGDTCFRPDLIDLLLKEGRVSRSEHERLIGSWLWDSDLIYHEATRQERGPHTAEHDLLSLPASIRSKLRLVHVPDGFTAGPLAVAVEGEIVQILSSGSFEIRSPDS